jgi:hypothetical protein
MSKRFNYEDDDFKDEDFPDVGDGDEEELSAEYLQILEKRELIEAIKLQIIQKELNFVVLNESVKYLEKTWFWRWKSLQTKLNLIMETYQTFKALVDIDASRYQEEENTEE